MVKINRFSRICFFSFRRFFLVYFLMGIFFVYIARRQPFQIHFLTIGNFQFYEAQMARKVFNEELENLEPRYLRAAIQYYKELLKILPTKDYAYGNMAFCYAYLGDYKRALHFYDRAIDLNSDVYMYSWDKGMILFEEKKYEQAILSLNEALRTIPKTVDYYKGIVTSGSINLSGDDESNFLLYFLNRVESDRNVAEVQIARSYFYLNRFAKPGEVLPDNLIFLNQENGFMKDTSALEEFIVSLKQYYWENIPLNSRLHFDLFIGSRTAKRDLTLKSLHEKEAQ